MMFPKREQPPKTDRSGLSLRVDLSESTLLKLIPKIAVILVGSGIIWFQFPSPSQPLLPNQELPKPELPK